MFFINHFSTFSVNLYLIILKLNDIQSDSKFSLNYIQPDSNQIIFKQILVEKNLTVRIKFNNYLNFFVKINQIIVHRQMVK